MTRLTARTESSSRVAILPTSTTRWSTSGACCSSSAGTSPATRPRWWRTSAGARRDDLLKVAAALCENSGRERTSSVVYSVGWTQHTVGVQNIRAASIVQLLLGNVGRPGGGILALRGHANIQGSTDIPTLYDILPGYIPMPHPQSHPTLDTFVELNGPSTGAWGNLRPYMVSLLKAWWGDAATEDNDFCFDYLPRINGDHAHYAMMLKMLDGGVKGMFCVGQNPTVGSANSKLMRLALAKLDWLVVRDFQPIESAMFWKDSPEHESGEVTRRTSRPRCSSCRPPRTRRRTGRSRTPSGSCSGITRRASRRATAARSCTGSTTWGRRVRQKLTGAGQPRDRPVLDLTWDYPLVGPHGEPDAACILQEISGRKADGSFLFELRRARAGRVDGLRIVDPLRRVRRWREPGSAQATGCRAELDRARLGLGVAEGHADHLQPRVGRRRRQSLVRAQAIRLVGRRGRQVDEPRRLAGLPADESAGLRARRRRQGDGRDLRRQAVPAAPGRARLAVRALGARRRAAAGALRAARVAVRQLALRPAAEPDAPGVRPARESIQPEPTARAVRRCSRSCSARTA